MDIAIEQSWKEVLAGEFEKEYFAHLRERVRSEYLSETVYPPPKLIFNTFSLCSFRDVRVVILGQDPYHGKGQAHGLSFSVPDGIAIPPSLQNIYKEIRDDLGITVSPSGNLERWARQGVLLLNATLTVRAGSPTSHQKLGWEQFTDVVIRTISEKKSNVVFMLWGRFAQEKASLIDASKHYILTAPHPSPFSAHTGFFGCKHFSKANAYLTEHKQTAIKW